MTMSTALNDDMAYCTNLSVQVMFCQKKKKLRIHILWNILNFLLNQDQLEKVNLKI